MRVAIVGANGFIGSRAVELFHLATPIEIVAVVRRYASLARLSRFDIPWRIADATDELALVEALRGCDAVVHSVAGGEESILGTPGPVYRAAETAGVRRIVYLSTASVHGQAPAPGTTEESPLRADHEIEYNNLKVRAEARFRELRHEGTVELVMLRPGIVFGPRDRWVSGFAESMLAGKAYFVGDGTGVCNSIYVDNLIEAVRLSLTAESVDNQVFLVGDAELITWKQFYGPIARALGFEVDDIPCVAAAEPSHPTPYERVKLIRDHRVSQAVLRRLPTRSKRAAGGVLRGIAELWRPTAEVSASASRARLPRPTREMTLLHRCRVKLPHTRAETTFGYRPVTSFAEGMERSLRWLRFAGYPVQIDTLARSTD